MVTTSDNFSDVCFTKARTTKGSTPLILSYIDVTEAGSVELTAWIAECKDGWLLLTTTPISSTIVENVKLRVYCRSA
jgi:hypothetical protein